jgi:serine/threonine protein kinase
MGDERPTTLEEGEELAPGRSVVRHIETGDLYATYLVWDEHRFSLGVAKVLRAERLDDDSARRTFAREVAALARLAHPVLVRSFDAVSDGAHPHVLLEHLEGATLSQVVRGPGSLPLEQLLPIALHIASALHYLEAEEMVHLDVKPANIVMGIPPRLIDLSLIRSLSEAARMTVPLGTDPYMAPEQCDPVNRGPVGSPADVWGLGATLYRALKGEVPFPTFPDANPQIATERFPQLDPEPPAPLPSGVPQELRLLIEATLRPSPEERPSASEMALALQPLVAALPRRLVIGKRGLEPRA